MISVLVLLVLAGFFANGQGQDTNSSSVVNGSANASPPSLSGRRDNVVSFICASINPLTHEVGPPVCQLPFDKYTNDGLRLSSSKVHELAGRKAEMFVEDDAFADAHSMSSLASTSLKIEASASFGSFGSANGAYEKKTQNFQQYATNVNVQVVVSKLDVRTSTIMLSDRPKLAPELVSELEKLAAVLSHMGDENATDIIGSLGKAEESLRNDLLNRWNYGFYISQASGGGSLVAVTVVNKQSVQQLRKSQIAEGASANTKFASFSAGGSYETDNEKNLASNVSRATMTMSISRRGGSNTPQTPADVRVWEGELLDNPDVTEFVVANVFRALSSHDLPHLRFDVVHAVRESIMTGIHDWLALNFISDQTSCMRGGPEWSLSHGCEQAPITVNTTGKVPLTSFDGILRTSRQQCQLPRSQTFSSLSAFLLFLRELLATGRCPTADKSVSLNCPVAGSTGHRLGVFNVSDSSKFEYDVLYYCIEPSPLYVFGDCFTGDGSCPHGFFASSYLDLTCCTAVYNASSTTQLRSAVVFGGMYSSNVPNPLADGQPNCPRDTNRRKLMTKGSVDYWLCSFSPDNVDPDPGAYNETRVHALPWNEASFEVKLNGVYVDLTSPVPMYLQTKKTCNSFDSCLAVSMSLDGPSQQPSASDNTSSLSIGALVVAAVAIALVLILTILSYKHHSSGRRHNQYTAMQRQEEDDNHTNEAKTLLGGK